MKHLFVKEINHEDIWLRFKDGDMEALSALYEQYINKLYSYGCKICSDDFLVKDCIQEVFIQLINKRTGLNITATTHLYLFKSLKNKLLEELRSQNRKNKVSQLIIQESPLSEISVEQSIVQTDENNRSRVLVEKALANLTDYQREAIFLRYSQEFSYEEIAGMLDIDVASARTLVYRSLKKVKEYLSSEVLIFLHLFYQ